MWYVKKIDNYSALALIFQPLELSIGRRRGKLDFKSFRPLSLCKREHKRSLQKEHLQVTFGLWTRMSSMRNEEVVEVDEEDMWRPRLNIALGFWSIMILTKCSLVEVRLSRAEGVMTLHKSPDSPLSWLNALTASETASGPILQVETSLPPLSTNENARRLTSTNQRAPFTNAGGRRTPIGGNGCRWHKI